MGRKTSRPWDKTSKGVATPPMPFASTSNMSPLEKRVIIEWIDMGARWRSLPVSDPLDSTSVETIGGDQ
jgi:hypothetical protein